MSGILQINSSESLENMERPFGVSWIVYAGTLYALTPLSVISAIMNTIAYLILRKVSFQTSTIFKYLRLNVLNSLIISMILFTKFMCTPYKFDFTNTYAAMFYLNHFYAPLLSIFYLNANFLDILIIIERIIKVRPKEIIKKIIKLKYFWAFLLMVSFIINIPNFYVTTVYYVDININNSLLVRSYFTQKTDFSLSIPGKLLTYLIFIIRDFVTLIIKINLNIISVVLIKKYFKKLSKEGNTNFQVNEVPSGNHRSNKKTYMTEVDRNMTLIAITMSVFSSIENLFFIFTYIYLMLNFNEFGLTLYFFANFIIAFKHSSNLIVLYSFNNLFKKEFRTFFLANRAT